MAFSEQIGQLPQAQLTLSSGNVISPEAESQMRVTIVWGGPCWNHFTPVFCQSHAVLLCLLPPYVVLLLLMTPCQQQAIALGSSQAAYSPAASFCQLPNCCSGSHIGFSFSKTAYSMLETPVYTGNLSTVLQRHTIY